MSEPKLTLAEIATTRVRLKKYLSRTPVHLWKSPELQERLGDSREVWLKLELFQHSGSFKPRGALSVMLSLEPQVLARGVTAVSAGNHAIATAYAARELGVSAKVVMVASASPARIERALAYGAEVVIAPDGKSGFALAQRIQEEEGRTFVHPFEGPLTALGTATLAVELHEQVPDLEALIVPIGGGGLCAGVSAAIKLIHPACRVFGVEPVGADTMHRSFASGKPESRADVQTIADSLAPPYALPYSFSLCRQNVDDLVLVDDDQIRDAMDLLFRSIKLAVEPAGGVATAALLGPLRERLRGRRVGLIVCGSNIDIDGFAKHIREAAAISGRH